MTIKEAYQWIWKNTNLMQDTMMLDFECLAYCVKHGILKEIDKIFTSRDFVYKSCSSIN